jgi:hypothetical protein
MCVGGFEKVWEIGLSPQSLCEKKRKVGDARDASMLHHVSSFDKGDLTLVTGFTKQILIPVGLLILRMGFAA